MKIDALLAAAHDALSSPQPLPTLTLVGAPAYVHLALVAAWAQRWLSRHGVRGCNVIPHVVGQAAVLDILWSTERCRIATKVHVGRDVKPLVTALGAVRTAVVALAGVV